MSDKYDKAIEYLTDHPSEIERAWNNPRNHEMGCLFTYAQHPVFDRFMCGCLTQIREGGMGAQTKELTKAIRADRGIPFRAEDITVETLPVFAEWQRRLDKELGRV